MTETYYTVEKISQLLSIHPKTIQRYIREGKLRASKLGKSWRVSGHDLSVFVEQHRPQKDRENPRSRAEVSAVIDLECDEAEADRITNLLTGALNSKPPEYGHSSMHTQYIAETQKLRINLWGGIPFTEAVIGSISALMRENDE